jgi:hypothetical protein
MSCDCTRRRPSRQRHRLPQKAIRSRAMIAIVVLASAICIPALAQSTVTGNAIVAADFSSAEVDRRTFTFESWNMPGTWELREGALACIYDATQNPGRLHGKSIDCRFQAHDIRVSYRARFSGKQASLAVHINAAFPDKTGIPVWHIGSANARLAPHENDVDVSIHEHDFTYDPDDPRIPNRQAKQAGFMKQLGAFGIPGASGRAKAALQNDTWHCFVVESVGTHWTMWVDGRKTLNVKMKHSDCDKESINFVGFGPLLIDDILVEELARSSQQAD